MTIETKYVLIRQHLFEKTNNICRGIIEFLIREYQCSWIGLSKFCWFVGTKFFVRNWFVAFQCKAIQYFVKLRGDVNSWVTLMITQYVSSFQEYPIHTRLTLRFIFVFSIYILHLCYEFKCGIPKTSPTISLTFHQ